MAGRNSKGAIKIRSLQFSHVKEHSKPSVSQRDPSRTRTEERVDALTASAESTPSPAG